MLLLIPAFALKVKVVAAEVAVEILVEVLVGEVVDNDTKKTKNKPIFVFMNVEELKINLTLS